MPKDKSETLENLKSDFIMVASHQLRTPISAIRWSLDTLLDGRAGPLSKKQIEVIEQAYTNNKFMIKVVNDLLKVTKVEEKGVALHPEQTDIQKIIKKVINDFEEYTKAVNCAFKFKFASNTTKVYFDRLNLEFIIQVLVENAIFYGQSKNNITLDLKRAKDSIILKIADQGIGITKQEQDKVFSKFFRGKNAMKVQTEGMGLSLYLVKKIIEAGGGQISFQSQLNKGTIVKLIIPAIKKDAVIVPNNKKLIEPVISPDVKKEREFVAITVHELKAPLGISKWSLEILQSQKKGKLNNDQLELINQVY